MRILVTGGAGFIGSNFVRRMATRPDVDMVTLDALTYAGNLDNLEGVAGRHTFVRGDICDADAVTKAMDGADAVVHFAAESHVDRSIATSAPFIRTNIEGTRVLLEAARECRVRKFVHVSTDEVYGSLGATGYFTEESCLAPNSPYSASKAGSDLLARAYCETYDLPVVITRCSNNYGPYQFPEKLIPLMVIHALEGRELPVYGDGGNVRDCLHVADHCSALEAVLHAGVAGEVYNIGGRNERTNLEIVKMILYIMGRDESLITFVKDRPGHDRRYAIDASKMERELGWTPAYDLERGLTETVAWYVAHREWWESILSGAYREYYERQYGVEL